MRGKRTSTEALLALDGVIASPAVDRLTTENLFLEWLRFNVLPLLGLPYAIYSSQLPMCTPYPGPLSDLFMDSASIHGS